MAENVQSPPIPESDGAKARLAGLPEFHHQVKNSFQSIISILNLELRKEGHISPQGAKKLSAQVYGFALLHDLIFERMKNSQTTTPVALDVLLDRVLNSLRTLKEHWEIQRHLASVQVRPRQATSLVIILTEVMSFVAQHGGTKILCELRDEAPKVVLTVSSLQHSFAEKVLADAPALLNFITTLAKADLGSQPRLQNTGNGDGVVILEFLPQS